MTPKGYYLLLTVLLTVCNLLHAQSSTFPSHDSAFHYAVQFYHESLGDQSAVYNGSLYLRPQEKISDGHPFFISDQLQKGSVLCDGTWYHNVPLLYDQVSEELITTDISGLQLMRLVKSKVAAFIIGEHKFVRLANGTPESTQGTFSNAGGYYRVLYEGRSMVLLKERKFIRQKIVRENESYRNVQTQASYWLMINNTMYEADNVRSIFNAFGSHRKSVQDHLRSSGFNLREARGPAIIEAAKFYDKQYAR